MSKKKRILKVAVAGALPDQQRHLAHRCRNLPIKLCFVNNMRAVPDADFVVVWCRFTSHSVPESLKKQLGRDVVVPVPRGGLSTLHRKIMDLLK